jgi:hypothetical protein
VFPDLVSASLAAYEHFTRLQRKRGAMNPKMKLLLAELDKRLDAQDQRFDERFAAQDLRFDDLKGQISTATAASSSRLQALEQAVQVFDEWRPAVDGVVDDLKQEVSKLSTLKVEVGRLSKHWDRILVDTTIAAPGIFASTPSSPSAVIVEPSRDFPVDTKPPVRPLTGPVADVGCGIRGG